jgi:hypothetical protein
MQVALGIAVFHFFFGPIEQRPTLEEYVAEKAISVKSILASKLKGQEETLIAEDKPVGPDEIVGYSVVVLGFIAICFGVLGVLKREEWRVSSMAIGIGASALLFKFAIAVAGALLLLTLIGAFLSGFGF